VIDPDRSATINFAKSLAPDPVEEHPHPKDFTLTDKAEDDLDGMSAWRQFGGLSIDDAHDRFASAPRPRG